MADQHDQAVNQPVDQPVDQPVNQPAVLPVQDDARGLRGLRGPCRPVVYMPNPDKQWRWKWCKEDPLDNMVMRNTTYLPISQAGLVARQTAKLIDDALSGANLPGGARQESYQVVVMSRCASCKDQAGLPDKQDILTALQIKRLALSWCGEHLPALELASVKAQDFALLVAGFAYPLEELAQQPDGPSNIDFEDEEWMKMIAATQVMADVLTDHFVFELDVRVGPIIYGGRARDGSIVGVLSTMSI